MQYSFHCKKQGKYKSLRSSSEWRSGPCQCRRTPQLTRENQIEGGRHQWKMLVSCTVFLAWLTMDSCPIYKHVLRLLNQPRNGSLSCLLSWYAKFWNMWENCIIQFVAVTSISINLLSYQQIKHHRHIPLKEEVLLYFTFMPLHQENGLYHFVLKGGFTFHCNTLGVNLCFILLSGYIYVFINYFVYLFNLCSVFIATV